MNITDSFLIAIITAVIYPLIFNVIMNLFDNKNKG